MPVYGIDAVIRIVSHLLFIYLAFWGLRSLRLEHLFLSNRNNQVKVTLLLLAVVIGYTSSEFFLEFLALCRNIFLTAW